MKRKWIIISAIAALVCILLLEHYRVDSALSSRQEHTVNTTEVKK